MDIIELPANSFYLVSYPRSGNTWMFYSLSMLLPVIRSEARSTFEFYPYLYGKAKKNTFFFRAEREIDMSRPLIIKSHESYDIYKQLYPPKKCIYVYRDGRDVLLSYFFFTKAFSNRDEMIIERIGKQKVLNTRTSKTVSFEPKEFTEFIRTHAAQWVSHVESWLKGKDVFLVKYEDLHRDFAEIITAVINYLGIKPVTSVSNVEKEYVSNFRQYFTNTNQNFFRRGIIGDWRNYFMKEHNRLFSEFAGDLLIKLAYK